MEKLQPIPHGYDESINSVLDIFDQLNQPIFKGFIKISARPAGSRQGISEELYCMDKDQSSHQKIFDAVCRLLQKATNLYGKKDFLFEISNKRNDSLLNIRVNISRKLLEVVDGPPKVLKPVVPQYQPAPRVERKPKPVVFDVPANDRPKPTPVLSDPVLPAMRAEDHVLVQFTVPADTADASANDKVVPTQTGEITEEQPLPPPPEIVSEPIVNIVKQRKTADRWAPKKQRPKRDPYPEPVPISLPERQSVEQAALPRPQVAVEPVRADAVPAPVPSASNGVQESPGQLAQCPNPDAEINYELMKSFPTEAKPINIRRAFEVCGIRTYGDILRRLGTVEPTGSDWETFITGIRTQAEEGGVKLWNSSGWILYWWLNEKMRWIKPFI